MSEFIKTKSPVQCRSHHQKFFKKIMNELEQDKSMYIEPQFSIQNGEYTNFLLLSPLYQIRFLFNY